MSDLQWETLDLQYIAVWEQASSSLSQHNVQFSSHNVDIKFDFWEVIERLRHNYRVMESLTAAPTSTSGQRLEFIESPASIKVQADVRSDANEYKVNLAARNAIESTLYDLFAILNVAAPGSCDLWDAELVGRGHPTRRLKLSNCHFDSAYTNSIDGKWPSLAILEVASVSQWFGRVRSALGQIPKNPMEKTIFSMLHMSKLDVSPLTVIWVFYALETLFDTKPGTNQRVLGERIALLLSVPPKGLNTLKRKLRDLYDLRSSIVHGGLEVVHPMNDDFLDENVTDEVYRYISAGDFGVAVIVASLQELVRRGWHYPEFKEVMSGAAM